MIIIANQNNYNKSYSYEISIIYKKNVIWVNDFLYRLQKNIHNGIIITIIWILNFTTKIYCYQKFGYYKQSSIERLTAGFLRP